jgi:hypothetical protein
MNHKKVVLLVMLLSLLTLFAPVDWNIHLPSLKRYDEHKNIRPYPTGIEIPRLEYEDLVYQGSFHPLSPVVIEEYNLVFFLAAKAASSEWIRFFMRLEDNPEWCEKGCIHDASQNGLTYLNDYPLEQAEEMMTSPKWTRAIFLRHPKPRLLSAFLDKAVGHKRKFDEEFCQKYIEKGEDYYTLEGCREHRLEFDFFLRNITTTLPNNVHWSPVSNRMDDKWWPFINYIATMEDLAEDAEHFLQNLISNVDGMTAWDRVGKTGWGDNERDCDHLGTDPFLGKKDTKHKTNAKSKMLQYYTPELENFVEEGDFKKDLNNEYFSFTPFNLFPETSKEGSDYR